MQANVYTRQPENLVTITFGRLVSNSVEIKVSECKFGECTDHMCNERHGPIYYFVSRLTLRVQLHV